jgi:hypothetical protein
MRDQQELLREAQKMLAIQDVYVREAHAFSDEEFDPNQSFSNLSVQFRVSPGGRAEQFYVSVGEQRVSCLRYIVETGMRVLKPEVSAETTNASREQLLAEILATFVVKYAITEGDEEPAEELVQAFADNAVHHVWPYWREFIQATTARLRLPAIVVPMRRTEQGTLKPTTQRRLTHHRTEKDSVRAARSRKDHLHSHTSAHGRNVKRSTKTERARKK